MAARRAPKPPSKQRLRDAALHYLGQRGTSTAHLRRVLARRAARALEHHGGDPEEVAGWIEEVLQEMARLGALDDLAFVEQRARALARSGVSTRAIRARLAQKGLASAQIDRGLEQLREELDDPDWVAACRFARRRGLGPFRRAEAERRPERELAAFLRAGFGYELARRVLATEDRETLEEVIFASR